MGTETFEYLELPVVMGSVVDHCLGARAGGTGRSDVRKLRQSCRTQLGFDDIELTAPHFSIGHGTISFELLPTFACTQTLRRWDSGYAERLVNGYASVGLDKLVRSKAFEAAMTGLTKWMTERLKRETSEQDRALRIVRLTSQFVREDAQFRGLALQLSAIQKSIALQLAEVSRTEGRIVRFEGDRVLVVEREEGMERLREYAADFLRAQGLAAAGDCYVRTSLRWTGDAEASVLMPALPTAEVDSESLEKELESTAVRREAPKDWPLLRRRER